MTKHLHTIATRLQQRLLGAGWPPSSADRVLVDAWAALLGWHHGGETIYRVRSDVRTPPVPPGLPLATAPVVRAGVCYVLDRSDWIIVARHEAHAVLPIRAHERSISYPAPVLVYATELSAGHLASGYVNLVDQPTPRHLRIYPGQAKTELGPRPIGAEELGEEMLRLARVLPLYYYRAKK
jgi:hypothetical protein